MTSCMGVLLLHITFSKYDCIIVHKAYYLFTCTCVSINSFHSHSHIDNYTPGNPHYGYYRYHIGYQLT